jgi:hypothetical protein
VSGRWLSFKSGIFGAAMISKGAAKKIFLSVVDPRCNAAADGE